MAEKNSRPNEMSAFSFLVNALNGGSDIGQPFPRSDAIDTSLGARFIPRSVTDARRDGKVVKFVRDCSNSCCWYWLFKDGTKVYHFDPLDYAIIGKANHGDSWDHEQDPAGPCPVCCNDRTNGGSVTAQGESIN